MPFFIFSSNDTLDDQSILESNDHRWNKIILLKYLIQMNRQNLFKENVSNWFLWIDADVVILENSLIPYFLNLTSTSSEKGIHLIMSRDSRPESGIVNTGMILIDNSDWAFLFLQKWWHFYDRNIQSDQQVFTRLFNENIDVVQEKVSLTITPNH